MELRNLKGTDDYLPKEQKIRNYIQNKLENTFEKYGYEPISTPIVSYFDILASKYAGGDEILKEIYTLKDQGGRELAFRYDLTVPLCRLIGMNKEIRLPFKRYEIGKVYRDGPVKLGRKREFVQCDVDVVGIDNSMAEAEFMAMTKNVFKQLNLDIEIVYSNRKILSGIIELAGINKQIVNKVILIVDKIEKMKKEDLIKELKELNIENECIEKLFYYIEMESKELLKAMKMETITKEFQDGIKELEDLIKYTTALNVNDVMRFKPSLARGLGIYTGTVWEVFLKDREINSSIGAGGRYDKIIGKFLDEDKVYPAVGMTFGLDVIYTALNIKNMIEDKSIKEVYIMPINTNVECMKLAKALRENGICVDMDMMDRKLKKSMNYADKEKIKYVIIVGKDEVKTKMLKVKDMFTGDVKEFNFSDIQNISTYIRR